MSKMNVNDHLSSHMAKLFSSWAKVQQKSAKNLVSVTSEGFPMCLRKWAKCVLSVQAINCFKITVLRRLTASAVAPGVIWS